MPGLLIFLTCTWISGWRVARVLSAREPEPLSRIERGTWSGILFLAFWLAQGHLLSFAGWFQAVPLLGSSILILASTLGLTRRVEPRLSGPAFLSVVELRRVANEILHRPVAPGMLLPLAFLGLCVLYSAAALWVLPVSNHDALSYHFPKAAWLTITGSFGLYPSQDLRVTYFPGNYEMLAATVLTFLRSDTATGFITSGSLLLFLAGSFCLFMRAWKETAPALLTLPLLLASPVVFLHVTAHKNDLLMAAVTLNALLWLGRFAATGGRGSAVIAGVSVALAIGTKFHGLFLVLACTILIWRAWRAGAWRPSPAAAALQGTGLLVLTLLLGGVQYLGNLASTGEITGILQVATPNAMNTVAYPAYWQVPRFAWMFLAAPFVTRGQYFDVPWTDETWFWPAYELYFSHYGVHVSLLILVLPVVVLWVRRQLDAATRSELSGISLAALALVGLNVLMGLRPYGGFAFIPRFLFFALPVLLVWTWCPVVRYLGRLRRWSWLPLAASLLIPTAYIGITVHEDRFSPLEFVELLWKSPEWRQEIYHSPWRAAVYVDRMASPDATVAIDSGYDGWTYPMFGHNLGRTVQVILDEPGTYVPGPEVDWVAVDRAFSIVWGHPGFQSMSLAALYLDRGSVPERELRVYRSLENNPDFKRVYFFPRRFQAVFQRVRPVAARVNPESDPPGW